MTSDPVVEADSGEPSGEPSAEARGCYYAGRIEGNMQAWNNALAAAAAAIEANSALHGMKREYREGALWAARHIRDYGAVPYERESMQSAGDAADAFAADVLEFRKARGAGPSSPVESVPAAGPVEAPTGLASQLARYLEVRQHTLSTAHLTGMEQLLAEAKYVRGEAQELHDAVVGLAMADALGVTAEEQWRHVRHEIADVVLSTTCLAGMLPGGVTVELCIAEKTEADRDRG